MPVDAVHGKQVPSLHPPYLPPLPPSPQVCGLRWSPDDRELASGGNDNQLFVWQQQSAQPVLRFSEHQAAVKAIAWSPHQHGLLVSGGGTADRCIRFWNTTTGQPLQCIDTGSQVGPGQGGGELWWCGTLL